MDYPEGSDASHEKTGFKTFKQWGVRANPGFGLLCKQGLRNPVDVVEREVEGKN
jgi:hypothetical protein